MAQVNQKKYVEAFRAADKDRSGKVDLKELVDVLDGLGKSTKPEDVERFFKAVDKDGSGLIDEREFLDMMEMIDNAWIGIQQKTFTRWVNTCLSERMMKIDDLIKDLRPGIVLVDLLEILSGKELPKPNRNPKIKVHRIENLNLSLNFLTQREKIKLVNIGSDDIEQGNLKIILGLIWTLILNYQIVGGEASSGGPKYELLQWVKKQIAPYGIGQDLQNFRKGWSDGRVLSALTDSLGAPMNATIDTNNLNPDSVASTDHAIRTATDKFAIPAVVDAIDVVDNPEEHSIMTYVSYFRDYVNNKAKAQEEEEALRRKQADPSHCVAYGPGLEGGPNNTELPFVVETRNHLDQPLQVSDPKANVRVEVAGPENVAVQVADDGHGKYHCKYKASNPGLYTFRIFVRDQPIGKGTWEVPIEGPNAAQSTAEGPGVSTDDGRKEKTHFTITARDAQGKPVNHGGDPFDVRITDPSGQPITAKVSDKGNGTYLVEYPLTKPGEYVVEPSLRGEAIKGAPFKPLIVGAVPAKSYLDGPGSEGAMQHKPTYFNIHSISPDGEPFKHGGDHFDVQVQGPTAPVQAKVTDLGNGVYRVDYTPHEHGPHTIDVQLRGEPLKNAPAHVQVKPAADLSKSWAEGPGLSRAFDNRPANFTVFLRDDKNEPIKDADNLVVSVTPADKKSGPANVRVQNNGDGSYGVSYEAPDAGKYVIDAQVDNASVKGLPKEVKVREGADEENLDGGTFKFTIKAKNKKGEVKTEGGDDFEVNVVGPPDESGEPMFVPVRTSDNGDGSYSAEYTLSFTRVDNKPQEFRVHARLNGKEIKGSPFKQQL